MQNKRVDMSMNIMMVFFMVLFVFIGGCGKDVGTEDEGISNPEVGNNAVFDPTRNDNNLLNLISKVDSLHENTVAFTEEITVYQNTHSTLKGSSDLYEKTRKLALEISSLQKDVNTPNSGKYKITDSDVRNHFSQLLGYDMLMLVEYTEEMKRENGKYDINKIRNIISSYNRVYSEIKRKI